MKRKYKESQAGKESAIEGVEKRLVAVSKGGDNAVEGREPARTFVLFRATCNIETVAGDAAA